MLEELNISFTFSQADVVTPSKLSLTTQKTISPTPLRHAARLWLYGCVAPFCATPGCLQVQAKQFREEQQEAAPQSPSTHSSTESLTKGSPERTRCAGEEPWQTPLWHPKFKRRTKPCLERLLVVGEHRARARTVLKGEGKLEQVTVERHHSTWNSESLEVISNCKSFPQAAIVDLAYSGLFLLPDTGDTHWTILLHQVSVTGLDTSHFFLGE